MQRLLHVNAPANEYSGRDIFTVPRRHNWSGGETAIRPAAIRDATNDRGAQ